MKIDLIKGTIPNAMGVPNLYHDLVRKFHSMFCSATMGSQPIDFAIGRMPNKSLRFIILIK